MSTALTASLAAAALSCLALALLVARQQAALRASTHILREQVRELQGNVAALSAQVKGLATQQQQSARDSAQRPAAAAKPAAASSPLPALAAWSAEQVQTFVRVVLKDVCATDAELDAAVKVFAQTDGTALMDMIHSDEHSFSFADKAFFMGLEKALAPKLQRAMEALAVAQPR
jgi:uncharacterized protein (UPF0264 family)